jgi:hypothetical protein
LCDDAASTTGIELASGAHIADGAVDIARLDRALAQALAMLWLGCGIFLTTLAVATLVSGESSPAMPGPD